MERGVQIKMIITSPKQSTGYDSCALEQQIYLRLGMSKTTPTPIKMIPRIIISRECRLTNSKMIPVMKLAVMNISYIKQAVYLVLQPNKMFTKTRKC